ncbi:MAG: FG-GAP-like repeat-containing protein, partial [Planctomycetota bacterium]|nr:FG-GAP-like repeat-containing protein [Planctomycetota bacterium]
MDVDGDGVDEVAVVKRSATNRFDELTFWSRSGTGQFHNVFDSGSMFTLSNHDFTSILKIGDTDGNGRSELALLQGGTLYILEATSSVPEPSTIVLALIAGAAVCASRRASSRSVSIS